MRDDSNVQGCLWPTAKHQNAAHARPKMRDHNACAVVVTRAPTDAGGHALAAETLVRVRKKIAWLMRPNFPTADQATSMRNAAASALKQITRRNRCVDKDRGQETKKKKTDTKSLQGSASTDEQGNVKRETM
jgi:hypothetical protein